MTISMVRRGKSPRQKVVVDIDKVMKQLHIKKSRYMKFLEREAAKRADPAAGPGRKRTAKPTMSDRSGSGADAAELEAAAAAQKEQPIV